MGLGCGGYSKLGQGTGRSRAESVAVVRRALDLGITLFDTAESYGTEEILGEGLRGVGRDSVVVATKKSAWEAVTARSLREGLEASLKRLGMDCVDVYFLHAVTPGGYDYAVRELYPALLKLRGEGKLQFAGVTEGFEGDRSHEMLGRAVVDGFWDVVMAGFNILNQTARERVFSVTRKKGIGTMVMFAVRKALKDEARLREVLADLRTRGRLGSGLADDSLAFLVRTGGAESLQDAAYRFCRHEPGVDAVLSGTGDIAHLEANAASLANPPLPAGDRELLARVFAGVDDVSGG